MSLNHYLSYSQHTRFPAGQSKWTSEMEAGSGPGISFAYSPKSKTGPLQGDDGQAQGNREQPGRPRGRRRRRRRRRSLSLADSDESGTTANRARPAQSELLTILADAGEVHANDEARLDFRRLRASAKSLNAALLERLVGSGQRPLDYQVFYPRRIYSPALTAPSPPPSSASLEDVPDNTKMHSKRHSGSGSSSTSAAAAATTTGPRSVSIRARISDRHSSYSGGQFSGEIESYRSR